MLILADSYTSLVYTFILPAHLCQDVVNGLFSHTAKELLEYARHTELPLHQVTDKHHQVLAEALEHEQVSLDIVHISYVLLDGSIDFLEESIRQALDFNQHLLAL